MNPRIQPIEKPKGLLSWLGFLFIKKELGKVTTVAKVIYVRFPRIMMLVKKMFDLEEKHSLPKAMNILIQTYVSTLNGCAFCMDVSALKAEKTDFNSEKLYQLLDFENSTLYSPAEKAALNYVAEVTKQISVTEETFSRLKDFWNDRQIIEITYAASVENFLNRMVKPLGIESDNLCDIHGKGKFIRQ